MDEQQLQEWLEERRKEISDAPMSPVLVLAHLFAGLIARVEALENAALPPEKPAKKTKTE